MIRKKAKPKPRSPVAADTEIGQRIRARRIVLKISQGELAEKLGVTFQQVQKYEKGVNRVNAARLHLIAKALDMDVEAFFEKDQAPGVTSLIDVNEKGTFRMLRAYGQIKDQATQRQMVVLIETIANAEVQG